MTEEARVRLVRGAILVGLTLAAAIMAASFIGCNGKPTPTPSPSVSPTVEPTPTPTPVMPPSCVPDTTGWLHRPGPVVNTAAVARAETTVKAERPELFIEEGHRLAKGADTDGIDEFFGLVGDALRRDGICAAQGHESGQLQDSLQVAVGDGAFESWQLVEYGAGRLRDLANACKATQGGCTWVPAP